MIQFLLAAPRSGSGKTTMTCALLMALKRRGCAPAPLRAGRTTSTPCSTGPCWGWRAAASTSFSLRPRRCAPSTRRVPPDTVRRCARGPWAFTTASAASATGPARGICRHAGSAGAAGGRAERSEPDAGRRAEGARKLPHSQPHRRHPAEQLHGPDARSAGPDAGRRDGPAGAGLSAEAPGGRHRFPPSGPLHGGGSGKFTAEAGPSGRRGRGAHRLAPPAGPLRKSRPPCRCSRRCLRPASASPWRRTRRSALSTPRRWRPSGTPGQRWSFSVPSATRPCRKTSAGCICPAATRNFTQEN